MAAVAQIDFRVAGADEVRRQFKSIAAAAADIGKASARGDRESVESAKRSAKERTQIGKSEAQQQDAFKRAHDAADRARFRSRVTDQTAQEKAIDAAGRARFRARVAEQIAADRAAAKAGGDAQRTAAKEGATAAKAAAKEASDFRRALDSAERQRFRDRVKEQLAGERSAARERTKIIAAAEQEATARNKSRRGAAAEFGAGAGRGFRSGVGTIAAVGQLAVGGLGVATVANAVTSQLDLTKRAALLENASDRNGVDGLGFLDFAKRTAGNVGAGVKAGDVMGGLEKISGKAGAAGIDQIQGKFVALAKVAAGAGVSIEDLGDVVGALVNRGVKADEMVSTVEKLVKQGKDGAVEFKDLAMYLDSASGSMTRFQMSAGSRIETAGGLAQLARSLGGRSTAAESVTSVEDLARDLVSKGDYIQGVTGGKVVGQRMVADEKRKVFDGGIEIGTDDTRTQFKDITKLLPDIIDAAGKAGHLKDMTGHAAVFQGTSLAVFRPLANAYAQGITLDRATQRYEPTQLGQKADLSGRAAVEALLAQFTNVKVGANDSANAYANVKRTTQFADAMERLTNELGDKLAPKVAELTPQIVAVGQRFGWLVGQLATHPKTVIASFLALKTAIGVAEVGIGQLAGHLGSKLLDAFLPKLVPAMNVTAGTVNVVGGGGIAGSAAGAAGLAGRAGMLGRAATAAGWIGGVVGAGIAGSMTGYEIAQASGVKTDKERKVGEGMGLEAQNLSALIASGRATPADMARARQLRGQLAENTQGGIGGAASRFIKGATAGISGLREGDFSLTNAVSALPPVAGVRGLVEGALSSQGKGPGSIESEGLKSLAAALDKPTRLAPGTEIAISNADAIGAAVANQMTLQSPKMPSVGGP